jgi:DNA-binding response OmpR family regulator
MGRLRRKLAAALGLADGTAVIKAVRGAGYRLLLPAPPL